MFTARQVRGWRSHRHSRPGAAVASHTVRTDTPDESWTKADIKAWLDRELIDYPSSATKADLLALVTDLPPLDVWP